MPELKEEMYCHQQICIPPTFPYLLRQYAKAAIRSQPIDLLKWSTAYFRCLSLNVPPPVKPRLEYPIPKDYVGITPGWLRALNYQLQNSQTVPFKILWDRWIGSCLQHETLIKILCLGGFTDPMAIPWARFLGLCAGHLTDSLTQTMILVCEIFTEEPEGGSAMIPLETFLDVYKFLAAIDASQPQILYNLYFTDSALNLYEKEKKKIAKVASVEEVATIESSTPTPEEVVEEQEPEVAELGEGSIVSCPDIASDEALQEPELDPNMQKRLSGAFDIHPEEQPPQQKQSVGFEEQSSRGSEDTNTSFAGAATSADNLSELGENERKQSGEENQQEDVDEKKEDRDETGDEDQEHLDEFDSKIELDKDEEEEDKLEKPKSSEDHLKDVEEDISEKGEMEMEEDHEELNEVGEPAGEKEGEQGNAEEERTYELLEEGREILPEQMGEIQGEGTFYEATDELEQHIELKYEDAEVDASAQVEEIDEEESPEEVEVDAIPGIGPVVPPDLVDAVVRHLTTVSAEEHGMTMPRHIRHYSCPPLEVYQ